MTDYMMIYWYIIRFGRCLF